MNRWVLALSVWNLFVWGGRLRNLIIDPGGLAEASRWSLAASVLFIGLALASLVTRRAEVAALMAGIGIGVWAFRGIGIAFADHAAGFIVVHSVLALVTIGLGVGVFASARKQVAF